MASGTTTVGKIQYIVDVSTKELKKGLDSAGSMVSSAAGKIGSGLANVGKQFGSAIATGLKVGTVAIAGLSAVAVKTYADFEQLSGGAQKIFDEIDYSKIEADAQAAYLNMGLSANQYLEAITGVGANLAATLGDEKGYETAKKGMQAIADFASGTGKDVDLLNQKYQAITRSTSTYQSIADQFAGILPGTSAGFLEQAQAAGFLSDSYAQLTDVPMAEYQVALTNMLEAGTNGIGLLGNTVAEAEGTITGSFNAMKAAWSNTLSSFASGDVDTVNDSIMSLVTSFQNVATNIITILPSIMEGIGTLLIGIVNQLPMLLETILPIMFEQVTLLITRLAELFPTLIPMLTEAAIELFMGLVKALPTVMQNLLDGIVAGIKVVMKWLTEPGTIDMLLQAALDMFMSLVSALSEILIVLADNLPKIIQNIIAFLTKPETINQLILAAVQLLMALVQAIPQIIIALANAIPNIITAMVRTLTDPSSLAMIAKAAVAIVVGLVLGLANALVSGLNALISTLTFGLLNNVIPSIPVSSVTSWIMGWEEGGYTGRGRSDEIAGVVHRGEYVIPAEDVDQTTGLPYESSGGRSGGDTFNIYLEGVFATSQSDRRRVAQQIVDEIEIIKRTRMGAGVAI